MVYSTVLFVAALTVLLTFSAVGVTWYRRRKRGFAFDDALEHASKWAGASSLLLAAAAIVFTIVIQRANDDATREQKLKATQDAAVQRELLESAVNALRHSSGQLKLNAEAATKAAEILEKGREDELRRLRMKPVIEILLATLNPRGGEGMLFATLNRQHIVQSLTLIQDEDQKDWEVRAFVLNKGTAIMQAGSLSFRCTSLDSGKSPTIFFNRVMGMKVPIEDEDVEAGAEQMFTDYLSFPLTGLQPTTEGVGRILDLLLRVPKPTTGRERRFTLSAEFQGYGAAARRATVDVLMRFGEEGNVLYAKGFEAIQNHKFKEAARLFEEAASVGNSNAMNYRGYMYHSGMGTPRNYDEARRWYDSAIAAGNTSAMNNLGHMYLAGEGVARDYRKALQWFLMSAGGGTADSMSTLGYMFEHGLGAPTNYEMAHEWYTRAIAVGSSKGMANLGHMYETGHGVRQNYETARNLYMSAAAAGNVVAMLNLAELYFSGRGLPQDYTQARQWYEKAAAGGNAYAMERLGEIYEKGQGLQKDYEQSRRWYEKGAAEGNAVSMNNLGYLYDHGFGVARDYQLAREWYEKASTAGNDAAVNNLGYQYETGNGVERDYRKAKQFYERAAALGNATAMANLAAMYDKGRGVKQDILKARHWYEKAARAGYTDVKSRFKQLSNEGPNSVVEPR